MFRQIEPALDALMKRKNQTYGIEMFKKCLNDMGNPQASLSCIHIGGTNGKGSTTNYTRAMLQEAGFQVGTFTSPHLIVHNDRIRINNHNISDSDLLMYINITEPFWDPYQLSMFEIDVLISILYFIDNDVDYAIYEVGLGGRLDATNVITPLVTGITNIGLDHMNILGDTVEKIAYEKAGIVKARVPLYTTEQKASCLRVFEEKTNEYQSPMHALTIPQATRSGLVYTFEVNGSLYQIRNQGIYQVANASLAINLIQGLPKISVDYETLRKAILETSWAGRFERVLDGVYLDGAHNEMGIEMLVRSVEMLPRPWVVVFTALKDKDYGLMINRLEETFDEVIITEFDFYRSETAENLARGHRATIISDKYEAIDRGLLHKESGTCIITGSLYFISEARAYLIKKNKSA
ncbi:bifunctional folylpolyglutamate synthase/dihydrofolate synthase [Erysipelothrix tonsillarum]|uniref:bifunctional folylpolyglutamate synthase/dihydrofolate synthase n=1 Tax=Erysipelothrix tonsillarum TaxID=38402 RepID=UPI000369CFDA|nr:folylpolyglutamate synthase/dihydrofolate synthase family protein [Erysipelothrix tonsillarum]